MDCLCARGKDIMIFCSDPKKQYLSLKNEIDSAVSRVLESGHYILGEEVHAFEKEFTGYIGAKYCAAVGSGTEALHLALVACGVGAGNEVITVSHTAVATVSAILLVGARPVFVDIREEDYTIDVQSIEAAITPRTKAIIAVHLYGHPAQMSEIVYLAKKHNLKVIEDCAQAVGSEYSGQKAGSIGDIGCFSFYPTKNLGAIGDGGAVVTNNEKLYEKVLSLRQYGWKERRISLSFGWNSRLDEIQAAILRIKLKRLEMDNAQRRKLAVHYGKRLNIKGVILPRETTGVKHVFHLFVIRALRRDDLLRRLSAAGIAAAIHYPQPVHLQPAFKSGNAENRLPVTEKICQEILSLPMYPELTLEEIDLVSREIRDFTEAYANLSY